MIKLEFDGVQKQKQKKKRWILISIILKMEQSSDPLKLF